MKNTEPHKAKKSESLKPKSATSSSTYLKTIYKKIHNAANIDKIFVHLQDDITTLFDAEHLIIYVIDGVKRELFPKFLTDNAPAGRCRLSVTVLPGYCALNQKLINIKNVYDTNELASIDPNTRFDHNRDEKFNFKTRQVLLFPIVLKNVLIGVIELINKKSGFSFSAKDETYIKQLAPILSSALSSGKQEAMVVNESHEKFDYLVKSNFLSRKDFNDAIEISRQKQDPVESILIKDFDVPKKAVGESLSAYYKLPLQEYDHRIVELPDSLIDRLNESFLRSKLWAPLRLKEQSIDIALNDPHDLHTLEKIKRLIKKKKFKYYVALKEDILSFIDLVFNKRPLIQPSIDDILLDLEIDDEEIDDAEEDENSSVVVKAVNRILSEACKAEASTIHIEPDSKNKKIVVRFRMDGVCSLYQEIPYQYGAAMVSRIKILAGLDIAERWKPQAGRISFKNHSGLSIDLKAMTIPARCGIETIAVDILQTDKVVPLTALNFSKHNLKTFTGIISRPHGMIVVSGLHGIRPSNIIYSALEHINKPEIKIWIVEKSSTTHLADSSQAEINPRIGFDTASGLRAILQADPDVIMVGNLNDTETVSIAVDASLSGHLVFSSLSSGNAVDAIIRLLDISMNPYAIANALLGILAVSHVRKLCPTCREKYHLSKTGFDDLLSAHGSKICEKTGMRYRPAMAVYRAKGCHLCSNTGYKGLLGIHELLGVTKTIKQMIKKRTDPERLFKQGSEDGMIPMKQDAANKFFQGLTDEKEIDRILSTLFEC
ncbi:ATPase, T2SS/T4P/T4SS family [Thermodesulfobacteriota bacterium]